MSGTSATPAGASDFSADDSILGFKYQLRYALYLLYEAQRTSGLDVAIDIERIDDIDVHAGDRLTKLVQTKDTATVLTNSSAPFWKTIRIWCEAIKTGSVSLRDMQSFVLVTTSPAPADDQTIVARLQQSDPALRQLALEEMRSLAAAKLHLATLGAAYRSFHELPAVEQAQLIAKIEIKTSAPTFDRLDRLIYDQIVHGPPDKRVAFGQVLFGRWDYLVETYLREVTKTAITWEALQAVLHEIALQFEEDDLPPVFIDMLREAFPSIVDDHRTFIRQLVAVGATDSQLQHAQRLYLRATRSLGFWQRNLILRPDEVSSHTTRLAEECQLQHDAVPANIHLTGASTAQIGLYVYNWALHTAPHQDGFRIRRKCTDIDVIRGCFQNLADGCLLGWHPAWKTMFT